MKSLGKCLTCLTLKFCLDKKIQKIGWDRRVHALRLTGKRGKNASVEIDVE